MEELQDAIEDAQYVNAIVTQEDGPRPILPWIIPTEEQLEEWREQVRAKEARVAPKPSPVVVVVVAHADSDPLETTSTTSSTTPSESCTKLTSPSTTTTVANAPVRPEPFSMDWMLQSAIGYFLFSAYLKIERHDYLRINFCEEVLRWKKLRGKPRLEKARRMVTDYLQPLPVLMVMEKNISIATTNTDPTNNEMTSEYLEDVQSSKGDGANQNITRKDVSFTERKMFKAPPMTEIDEYDLERPCPNLNMTKEDFDKLYENNVVPSTTVCGIGLDGPVREEILRRMQDMEQMRIESRQQRQESRRIILKQQLSIKSGVSNPREDFAAASSLVGVPPAVAAPTSISKEHLSIKSGLSTTSEDVPAGVPTSLDDSFRFPGSEGISNSAAAGGLDNSTHAEDDVSVADQSCRSLVNHLLLLRLGGDGASQEDVRYLPNDMFDKAEALIMESLRREYWDDFLLSEQYSKLNMYLWNQYRPVVLDDFFVMRVLGRGGFGLVTACKKGTSGKLYAMKIMNKRRIKMKKSEQLALNERQVLAAVESPFVLNLKYSFHSKDDVYLILDLMTGGDLGYHLHQKGRFPKRESQYFAARIMLGLQALHDKQYVYRDLKPENCLLADDGRVKITDLGLATKITPTLHGAAGTRGYWAPEMLRRDKKGKRFTYGHTVDWYSFGCCVAEFICGYNPFRSEAALRFGMERGHQTKDKAIDCATLEMDPVFDPIYFEPDAVDLCRKLLDKNDTTRLGRNGCEEIMSHPWFKNVNWEMIITDRKKPPFTPPQDVNAASQSEIGTFAEDKETVIDERDELIYKNWDWTNPRAFAAEVIEVLIYERETGEPLLPSPQNPTCCCGIL